MARVSDVSRRLLLGRRRRSDELRPRSLHKRVAVPVFGSDMLSSVAYAPDEILLTLAVAGLAAYAYSIPVAIAVVVVLAVVTASYRATIEAYPSGGGDYLVARSNLGQRAGVLVGASLLVDYVLVVAVSLAAAASYVAGAVPWVDDHRVSAALAGLALLTVYNLRGLQRWSGLSAIAPYLFVGVVGTIVLVGVIRVLSGDPPVAPSADLDLIPTEPIDSALAGLALGALLLRTFSVGSVSLAGVHTIVSGTPSFERPRARNAAQGLTVLAALGSTLLLGVIWLSQVSSIRYSAEPMTALTRDGVPVGEDYLQAPVLSQLATAVFGSDGWPSNLVGVAAVLVLLLAGHMAFSAFPVLGSVLARDGLLPRHLYTRGDRLAFTAGIITLAAAAGVLLVVLRASLTSLIQLYVVGVFIAFVLGQAGMVVRHTRLLREEVRPEVITQLTRTRVLNWVGLVLTSLVLVVVLIAKFARGAWAALLLVALVSLLMLAIRRHYDQVTVEATPTGNARERALPARVHAIVLISALHRPTLRAIAYARASGPSILEAVTVDVDPRATRRLMADWEKADLPVPLRVLDSPYREITRPTVAYVKGIRRSSPRDVVAVFIPEYVSGRWWERQLHNRSTDQLKARLSMLRGVMVTSVPWQLSSATPGEGRTQDPT